MQNNSHQNGKENALSAIYKGVGAGEEENSLTAFTQQHIYGSVC